MSTLKGTYQKQREPTPPPPTPSEDESQDCDSQDGESEQERTPTISRSESPIRPPDSPTMAKKKSRMCTDFTLEEEQNLVSWMQDNEITCIYNKKLNIYKDYKKKETLWVEKAESMGRDTQTLKTWYKSIRTRYTKLIHRKSGDGATELTERDNWILQNFTWLRDHVAEVKKKPMVSIKQKLEARGAVDNTDQCTEALSTDPETTATERLEPPPRKSARKSTQEEERLLNSIATREEQSIAFQTRVLEMLAPAKATERTTYADWAKEVMISIHPSLWLRFQRECSNLLYTYQEKSEEMLRPQAAQHFAFPSQPQFQTFQRTDNTSSLNSMWQPPPHQWPSSVQPTSVWGSQNSAWVQAQMTDNQQVITTSTGPSPTPLSTANCDNPPSQQTLSLGKVIRETIGTDYECSVTTQSE